MIKKLTRHGNSWALIIDKPIMELLGITPDTPLNVSTNGQGFQVIPAGDAITDEEVDESFQWAEDKYGRMMKRLAE